MRPGKRGTRSSPSPGKSTAEGVAAVVVKRGSKGAIVGLPDSIMTVAPPAVVVDNATGAGDTFCGGLAAGLALGEPLLTAAMRGAATAGATLGASGSLRLLRREAIARQLFTCYEQGRTPALKPSSPVGDDSDVMQREITTIPAVIRDRLGLASQAAATAEGLHHPSR